MRERGEKVEGGREGGGGRGGVRERRESGVREGERRGAEDE